MNLLNQTLWSKFFTAYENVIYISLVFDDINDTIQDFIYRMIDYKNKQNQIKPSHKQLKREEKKLYDAAAEQGYDLFLSKNFTN